MMSTVLSVCGEALPYWREKNAVNIEKERSITSHFSNTRGQQYLLKVFFLLLGGGGGGGEIEN